MPASRLHPLWRMVFCAIALFIVLLVFHVVGLAVLLALPAPQDLANLPVLQRAAQLEVNNALFLTVITYPLGACVLYLFRTRVDKYSWRSLGFSRERALPNFGRGALTAFLTLSVLFGLMWLAGIIRFGGWSSDALTHSAGYALVVLAGYGIAFGAVGFFEETVFRGYGLANLRQWLGWPVALIGQAAVFALVHLINGLGNPEVLRAAVAGLPNLFLIAIFFGLSYRKTGSLWFPIGFHVAWNWLLGCVFSLPVSGIPTFHLFDVQATGTSALSGGLFGAEGSLFLSPLVLAMIYALSLVPDHPRAIANLDAPEEAGASEPSYYPAPVLTPTFSSTPSITAIEEAEEETRTNRYSARFGSAQGFDSDMLRELKQMQEARDQAERERVEAERAARRAEEMRQAEIRRAQLAAQAHASAVAEQNDVEPVEEQTTPVAVETPTKQPIAAPVEPQPETRSAPTPIISPEPSVTAEMPSVSATRPVPVAPPAPIIPPTPVAPSPPATAQPESAPTPPTPPAEAPPKKARPRW